MRLSRNFLNDYVDTTAFSDFEFADNMINLGNEYASVERLVQASGLVIAEVLDCKPHPDSDHLSVCQVNVGSGETLQIVCGAANVRAGIKVIVSLAGAILPGDFEIKKTNIRGQESNGMICALGELGIEDKYLDDENKQGIHILDDNAPVGGDPLKYLHFNDTVISFELTANRGDLLSIIGMAYEANVFCGKELKLPDIKIKKETGNFTDDLKLNVQSENIPLYLTRKVKNIKIGESPQFIKARLIASGIRPINNVVDISNYVMLEFGQPLHFFDAKSFDKEINVRMAREGEDLTTLDGTLRKLNKEDIVIASEKDINCLAGVMGSLSSEVGLDTQDIIIESAIFNGANIRRTAKRSIRSEASNRFEKGLNPEYSYLAIDRACQLLEKYAEAEVVGGMLVHDKTDKVEKKLDVSLSKINSILGMELSVKKVGESLDKLGFTYSLDEKLFKITVPKRRGDVAIAEDIVEEVGRVIGINQIEGKLLVSEDTAGTYDEFQARIASVAKRMRSMGLHETINYSLVDNAKINRFSNDLHIPIAIQSPMTEDRKILRTSLIPSLIDVYDYNYKHNNKDISIYESANVYFEGETETAELALLSGLIGGEINSSKWQKITIKADFYYLKGIVEELLEYLGLGNRYSFNEDKLPKDFHPYQAQGIYVDKELVGYLGKVHPSYSKYDLYVFELNMNKLLSFKIRNIKDKEISIYPNIEKDLSFIIDKETESSVISKIIKRSGTRLLSSYKLFDYYEGDNIAAGKKSLTYRLVFNDLNKTLKDDEVNQILSRIISEAEKVGANIRTK